jgi:diguanylate cyclase (GGDEF)-like protein
MLDEETLNVRGNGTIIMVDLNKFKDINDQYGHVIGDKVLIHLVIKLKESGGRVVRYGGDEFIVIFDAKFSMQQIETKMEKILEYFQKINFKTEMHSFKISFSYGMAPFVNGSNLDNVIELADKAMYQNKSMKK